MKPSNVFKISLIEIISCEIVSEIYHAIERKMMDVPDLVKWSYTDVSPVYIVRTAIKERLKKLI
jgi:hypothetical protein